MNQNEFKTAFEAMIKLRGKKRTAAFENLAEHGEALLKGLSVQLLDDNKSRADLAFKLLCALKIGSDEGVEMVVDSLGNVLKSTKPSQRTRGLDAIEHFGARLSAIRGPLAKLIAEEQQEPNLSRAVGLVAGLGLDKDELALIVDPALDSWSSRARAAASELITRCGQTPRASVWQGCPLSEHVLKQVQRLGGSCKSAWDPAVDRKYTWSEDFCTCDGATDAGSVADEIDFPAAAWFFDRQLSLPGSYTKFRSDFDHDISFIGASENFDVAVGGKRCLLYIIAYDEMLQNYSCFDLLESSNDPPVYHIDHSGDDPYREFQRLSLFLGQLRPKDD